MINALTLLACLALALGRADTLSANDNVEAASVSSALRLRGNCQRVFVDGGSNDGSAVLAFLQGQMYDCAMSGPSRLYPKDWPSLSRKARRARMQPLREPRSWCIRSFESNAKLWPSLAEEETKFRAPALPTDQRATESPTKKQPESHGGADVRFIHGALSNVTAAAAPQNVAVYAHNKWGSTATAMDFEDIFGGRAPRRMHAETLLAPSYDLRSVIDEIRACNHSAIIAIRLDIEGGELWRVQELAAMPDLLCSISYLFVEFHHLPGQRANLTKYGFPEDHYEIIKRRVHRLMETPGCKLRVYWRSFWSACGDPMRFQWAQSFQATDQEEKKKPERAKTGAKGGGKNGGRRAKERRRGRAR